MKPTSRLRGAGLTSVCEGISQVPPNAQEDDHAFEMPLAEQCLAVLGSRSSLPDQLNSRLQQNQLMGYSGLVSREYTTGNRVQRGAITKQW